MVRDTAKTTPPDPGSESYLKGKNSVYLWSFIGINLAVFVSVLVTKGFVGESVEHFWGRVSTKDGIIAAGIPLLAMVLSGVVGDLNKARLVFWRWRDPLPGCRVFSDLMGKDPRIDVPALKKKLGRLPKEPQAQNALWYRLYKEYRGEITISEAHRVYLLTRDMATIAAVFVVLLTLGVAAVPVRLRILLVYGGGLIGQYLLLASAARNYGTRFVLNVLAEVSQGHS